MQQVQGRPASFSTPLPGTTLYHPGGRLVVALVFAPFLATSVAVGIFVAQSSPIPFWAPAIFAGWALLTPVFWLNLKTVRTSPLEIAAGRPWQMWREIPFGAVARVEQRGWRVRVAANDGARIAFTPALLHQGTELRHALLTQVAPAALSGALAEEARRLTISRSSRAHTYVSELPGILRIRPRRRWRACAALATLVALAAGGLAAVALPPQFGLPLAALALAVALASAVVFAWLSQVITLSDAGISVGAFPSGRARGTRWADVVVLEYTPRWSALRLTGKNRLACPGPGVMRPLDADVYDTFLERRLREREPGVLEAMRDWLL